MYPYVHICNNTVGVCVCVYTHPKSVKAGPSLSF